jgi:ankyrin repeat protein
VLSTLDKLSKGSAALGDAYSEAIRRIDGQLAEDRLLARRALSWISCAQRLLTTKELCHALAIERGDKALNNNNIYDVEDVISVCAGLVTVDAESNIVRLVHYTTQEYFERELLTWNPGAQEEIAAACLTYLSFDTFRSGSCTSDEAFEQRLAENAFFDYSARYWSEHTRPVENTNSCLALAFLCDEALVDCIVQGALTSKYKYKGYSRYFPNRTSGLHLTAMYGLLYLTESLLLLNTGKVDADSKDNDGRPPLSWAAENGHEEVVKLLLEKGADPNSQAYDGRTPLLFAADRGHEAVVRLLVKKGADIKAKDNFGATALHWAARNDHTLIMSLLLENDASIEVKEKRGGTPLVWAIERKSETGIKKLLAKGAEVEYSYIPIPRRLDDLWGEQQLLPLLRERDAQALELLIAVGAADEDLLDDLLPEGVAAQARTPLLRAVEINDETIVSLLLGKGAKPDSMSRSGQTPLSLAREIGNDTIIRLLESRIQSSCVTELTDIAGVHRQNTCSTVQPVFHST